MTFFKCLSCKKKFEKSGEYVFLYCPKCGSSDIKGDIKKYRKEMRKKGRDVI